MTRTIFLMGTIAIAVNISSAQSPKEFTGRVISVIDGNTLEIAGDDNQTSTVVLIGIDSPELNQAYGDKAKRMLEKLSLEKKVTVRLQGKDRKGQNLAEVFIDGNIDIRVELLKEGMAWTSERNPLPELETHRVKAQQKGKGLWKQDNPVPPWIFRRQQSMLQAKSS